MKKKRIGIDALPLTMPKTGVANYIFYFLEEILNLLPDCDFYLYAHELKGDLPYFSRFPNVTICTDARLSKSLSLWIQTTLACLLYRDQIDVFWATTQIYPLIKRKRTKVLFTLLDFVHLLYPETLTPIKCFAHRLLTPALLKHADYIVPISYGSAKRLKDYYELDHHSVIEPPIKPWLKPIEKSLLETWLMAKGLSYKGYFLTVGTLEPRKNLEGVLTTYAATLVAHEPSKVFPLVVMGGDGWKTSHVKTLLAELSQKYPKNVIITGYASEADQWHYLAGARYLLMLSHYEGYGMPIAEARVCGTEVICTDVPEMREAALEQGIFLTQSEYREKLQEYFLGASHEPFPKSSYSSNREKGLKFAAIISSA